MEQMEQDAKEKEFIENLKISEAAMSQIKEIIKETVKKIDPGITYSSKVFEIKEVLSESLRQIEILEKKLF